MCRCADWDLKEDVKKDVKKMDVEGCETEKY